MINFISLQSYAFVVNTVVMAAVALLVTRQGYQCRLMAIAGRKIMVRQCVPKCKACRFVER